MKTRQEILERIEEAQRNGNHFPEKSRSRDFYDGWVDALRWVMNATKQPDF